MNSLITLTFGPGYPLYLHRRMPLLSLTAGEVKHINSVAELRNKYAGESPA